MISNNHCYCPSTIMEEHLHLHGCRHPFVIMLCCLYTDTAGILKLELALDGQPLVNTAMIAHYNWSAMTSQCQKLNYYPCLVAQCTESMSQSSLSLSLLLFYFIIVLRERKTMNKRENGIEEEKSSN